MSIDLVIFDCDGVLVDSELLTCEVIAREMIREGFPVTFEDLSRRFTGISGAIMFPQLEAEFGKTLPPGFTRHIEACIIAEYRRSLKPIEGAAEALGELSRPVCVASGSRPAKLCAGLIETGLFDHFYPHIYSTTLVARGKPAPDIFLYAAARMGVRANACIVIEDSVAGVTAARAAGMRAIGFAGGTHCWDGYAGELEQAGAERVVSRFNGVMEILRTL